MRMSEFEERVRKSWKKVESVLGDNYPLYRALLLKFFSCGKDRLTKDDLDEQASCLFTKETREAHYEFLFTILNGTSTVESVVSGNILSSTSSNRDRTNEINSRKRKLSSTEDETSNSCDSICNVKINRPIRICAASLRLGEYIPLASRDNFNYYTEVQTMPCVTKLNDVPLVYCRTLIMAWKDGLDWVHDRCIQYLLLAIRHLLKTIVMATITRRKTYQLRENRFQHAVGRPSLNIYMKNAWKERNSGSEYGFSNYASLEEDVEEEQEDEEEKEQQPSVLRKPTVEWYDSKAALETSCDTQPVRCLPPISAWDLFHTLQVHRDLIPSHGVYAPNMELIISKLYHPSEEELAIKHQVNCDTALWRFVKHQEKTKTRLAKLEKEQNEQRSVLDRNELQALQTIIS